MGRAGLICTIVLVPLIIFFQWFLRDLNGATLATPYAELARSEEPFDPGVSRLTLESKVLVKSEAFLRRHREFEPDLEDTPEKRLAGLSKAAPTRVDRMRLAIVAGEIKGAGEAVARLDELKQEVSPGGDLESELTWLRGWYATHASGTPQPLPDGVQAALISRHGWFGQLALSHGRPDADAYRQGVVGGFEGFLAANLAMVLVWIVVGLAGLVCAGLWIAGAAQGRITLALRDPAAPTGVYLETFAAFCAAFLLVLITDVVFLGTRSTASDVVSWALLCAAGLAALWPLLRGVSWSDMCSDMGLHAGAGVAREVGAGVFGYLAAIPLTLAGAYIAMLISLMAGGETEERGGFPLFDQPDGATWLAVLLGMIAACVWAPIVEETLFRGCLYSRLRTWMPMVLAALVSAAVFGAIHPYSPSGLFAVGLGGVAFAIMREWRGSLIAPMVAHFLHNASIEASNLLILSTLE